MRGTSNPFSLLEHQKIKAYQAFLKYLEFSKKKKLLELL